MSRFRFQFGYLPVSDMVLSCWLGCLSQASSFGRFEQRKYQLAEAGRSVVLPSGILSLPPIACTRHILRNARQRCDLFPHLKMPNKPPEGVWPLYTAVRLRLWAGLGTSEENGSCRLYVLSTTMTCGAMHTKGGPQGRRRTTGAVVDILTGYSLSRRPVHHWKMLA
jgi:hypothetical protein